jgi:LuxR family maltose regulon positive regulatory protein
LELAGESPAGYVSHRCLGDLYYEWNDLKAAVYHVQRAIEQIKIGGTTFLLAELNEMLASCLLALGDKAGAAEVFEKACRIAHNNSSGSIRAEHAARHIFLALRQDDLAAASQWGNRLAGDIDFLAYDLRHVEISLLIAQGRKAAAAEALRNIYAGSITGKIQSNSVLIRLYQALSADTQESALEFLSDALTMAETEGYVRTFVDRGKLLVVLLKKALSRGITPEYTGKLLKIIEAEEGRKRALKSEEKSFSSHLAILSGRELEVLRLMAEELSNQQIAEKLFISPGTVKIHAHNILEKLGVKARAQAVARAREINII